MEMMTEKDEEQSAMPFRSSFSFQTWQRLKNLCHALRQTEDKVRNLKSAAEGILKSTERIREKRAELQSCRISVESMESQLEWRRRNARTAAARLTQTRHRAAEHLVRMNHFSSEIDELRTVLVDKQRMYIGVREKLILAAAQLFMRRRQMIQELREIFTVDSLITSPVTVVLNGKSISSLGCNCKSPMRIINVHLADAEDYYGHSEAELAVGLSYVVQALMAISHIFDYSLRYRVVLFGSSSSICDFINPELPPNQRTFPLSSHKQDKVAFQYGVFLLNKNIAQLRCDCGTVTQDLRCTLANVSSLINHLSDAKLEPYLYITRAIRLANEDGTSSSLASYRRQSPSTSSGAPSSDSGERPFRLEIPPSRLSTATNGTFHRQQNVHDWSREKPYCSIKAQCQSSTDFEVPSFLGSEEDTPKRSGDDFNGKAGSSGRTDSNSKAEADSNGNEDSNGNVNTIISKEMLRTCYLTSDDDDQLSQPELRQKKVVRCEVHLNEHFKTSSDCTTTDQPLAAPLQSQTYPPLD